MRSTSANPCELLFLYSTLIGWILGRSFAVGPKIRLGSMR